MYTTRMLQDRILQLKKEKNICILAHAYQSQDIWEVADYVGDSYGLSLEAAKSDAQTVLMCGVRFMAETVKILSPEKKVLLSHPQAGWNIYKNGGRIDVGIDAVEWASRVEKLGAGEILLTSMDCDGTKAGYDLELTRAIAETVHIPVIASGGAGTLEHFYDALTEGKADAALAASLFHYKELEIREVKKYLADKRVSVRL